MNLSALTRMPKCTSLCSSETHILRKAGRIQDVEFTLNGEVNNRHEIT